MKKILLLNLAILLPFVLRAQYTPPPENTLTPLLNMVADVGVAFPLGRFRSALNQGAIRTKGLAFFYRVQDAPLDLGLRWDAFSYDHTRRAFEGKIQKTKCKIWNLTPTLRLEPPWILPFRPYIEGGYGFNRFFTKTFTFIDGSRLFPSDDENFRFDNYDLQADWGRVFSLALGVYVTLEEEFMTSLDLQLGFRLTSFGQFLKRNDGNSIQEIPIDNYDFEQGSMAIISLKVGISVFGYK